MASSALRLAPWLPAGRARFKLELLTSRAWSQTKNHFSASYQIPAEHPSAKALEKMPYPTTPVDHSIFEEESSEYTSITRPSPTAATPDSHRTLTSVQVLEQLVQQKKFKDADRLLSELLEMRIQIPLNPVYEGAARRCLDRNYDGNRLESFTRWFSLLPNALHSTRKFRAIRYKLLGSPHTPPLDLIVRFGLIAASKGHHRYIMHEIVSTVVRYAHPAVSAKFLRMFEAEALAWRKDIRRGIVTKKGAQIQKDLYSLAVRTQTASGRLQDAVDLLQNARSRGINVTGFTYQMLMRELEQKGHEELLVIAQHILPTGPRESPDVPEPVALEIQWDHTNDLSSKLRALRGAYRSGSGIFVPHEVLVSFFREYRAGGHHRALNILRDRAVRLSNRTASNWALAEMLYYRERQAHRALLITFKTYFHLIGVPADAVRLETSKPKLKLPLGQPIPLRDEFITSQLRNERKLWPSPYHTALVWGALGWLSNNAGVESLYKQLIYHARQSQKPNSSPEGIELAADADNGEAITPSHVIDNAHFTHFMLILSKRKLGKGNSDRLAQVLADSMRYGIPPTVQHWTILAGACAQYGEPDQALTILDGMQEQSDRENGKKVTDSEKKTPAVIFPSATLTTYNNILRGFIGAGRLQHALRVEERILERFGPEHSDWPFTNRHLQHLRELEVRVQGGQQVC